MKYLIVLLSLSLLICGCSVKKASPPTAQQTNAVNSDAQQTQSATTSDAQQTEPTATTTAQQAKPAATKDDQIIDYLTKKVPEINKYAKSIERDSHGKSHCVMYVESEPNHGSTDEYARDYYTVYVGESRPDVDVNWERFLVSEKTKEILWYSVLNDDYYSLAEWRKSKEYRQGIYK